MITLKAGYYIDEIDKKIKSLIGEELMCEFYQKNLFFEIDNITSIINFNDCNPLLKVVWNIISRGEPTRASIKISEDILKSNFGVDYYGYNKSKSEIELEYNQELFDKIDLDYLKSLILNFNQLNEKNIANDYGSIYLKLYRILLELRASAQIQRNILISLFSKNHNDSIHTFKITGIRDSLCNAIVEDLNELLNCLNNIILENESKLNSIRYEQINPSTTIGYNSESLCTHRINTLSNIPNNHFSKILTDRRIKYGALGNTRTIEKDGKYLQNFEYTSIEKENALNHLLNNIFRKSRFKPGQEAIINRAIQGKDVIGLLPTGGGKSLTYQICSLIHPGVTVVVDPINSLMKDQFDKLKQNGISKTNYINSFNTKDEREKSLESLLDSEYLIIFVSPERFQIEKFRQTISSCQNQNIFFSYAIIDEAHCVSEWGHDFRHTYLKLAQNLKRFCKPKVDQLCIFGLTATASFDVLADVQRELELKEDSIISLPAEAIDRRELNFEIKRIDAEIPESLQFWERENYLGQFKYPEISKTIENLPKTLEQIATNKYGYLNPNSDFFSTDNGEYLNAGLIFCPTKSSKLKNGVLSLYDYLKQNKRLEITTFFGGGSDDAIKDTRIETEAELSQQNQEDFINNKKNLMIATKAFGMGIDKPNIRYSIHYTFPNSVESFYQEAGRSGRDGKPSLCLIIYHPEDIHSNYEFYKNAFKGIDREKEIINELLDEVQYEDDFYVGVLTRIVKDKYPIVGKISLWNNRYLSVFGPYSNDEFRRVNIGKIDLDFDDLRNYDDFRKNIELDEAKDILDYIREKLREECTDRNYIKWLSTKSTNGIKTLIDINSKKSHKLKVGFTNDIISKMSERLIQIGNKKFDKIVLRAAYNFSSNEYDFIDNLKFRYHQFMNYNDELILDINTEKYLTLNYNRIRNSSDTQRAIYRMSIVGIIDDYVINYEGGYIEIIFKAKSPKEYLDNFRKYLGRYLGHQSTEQWIERAQKNNEKYTLKRVLYTLVAFIEEEISDKRKRSIDYMQQLCELGYEHGQNKFRENIIYYFTSKYARLDYLPKETDGGRIENVEIVKRYLGEFSSKPPDLIGDEKKRLGYITNPPDGLGGEIDNAKHLRGACENLRISMTKENASIDILTSFSLFALESISDEFTSKEKPLINQAINLYRSGFRRLLKTESWDEIRSLIEIFNYKVIDINPKTKTLLSDLTTELLINRTQFRLNQFINKIS